MSRSSNLRCAFLIAAAVALGSAGAWAQASTPGRPDNAPQFAKLSPAAIAEFKANPLALLTTYASAGLPLTTEARSLLLTDPSLIDDLITAAKSGSDAQKAAIGAGLAQASRILARSNPQTATTIQQKVAASGLLPLITAFIAGSNGIETAAVGGGGGGAAGGGGGPTGGVSAGGGNGGGNTGAGAGTGGSAVTANGFTGNSAAGATGFANGATTNGGTTITTTTSVSPTL
jgi:hypothetical protein